MSSVNVTHFTDPGCPWAYSATPSLAVLRWRFGDQLNWRHVMIGLREVDGDLPAAYTPQRAALGWQSFRRFGMPFAPQPKEQDLRHGPGVQGDHRHAPEHARPRVGGAACAADHAVHDAQPARGSRCDRATH